MEGADKRKQKQRKRLGGLFARPNAKKKGKNLEMFCGG